jgi:two-component system sensor histidine kinase DesK
MTTTDGPAPREGGPGRIGVLFAGIWLVFLADPVTTSWSQRDTLAGQIGLASTIVFGLFYLRVWVSLRRQRHALTIRPPLAVALADIAVLSGLAVVMCVSIGQDGTAAAVYIAVTAVMLLPVRVGAVIAIVIAVGVELLSRILPGWGSALGVSMAVCLGSLAVYGIQQVFVRNIALVAAREENAELAIEEERNRFARDLHDILGHSLTVITVKAELASRLFEADPDRAKAELADLERLSRDALADVRRAVEGYRELTLPSELTRARMALQAADIEADLPNSTDDVPTELRDLFAWTVREGVTNVIRHSGATRCAVRLDERTVQICDDGSGPAEYRSPGHGLNGLRERATAVGAVLVTRTVDPQGFQLEVSAR